MTNKGYILKEAVMSATEKLADKDFRKTITALFNYAVFGKEPEFTEEEVMPEAIFTMERPAIDNNNIKWAQKEKEIFNNKNRNVMED